MEKQISRSFRLTSKKFLTLEGCGRPRRHRHATIRPNRLQIPIRKGDVTKIELELEEAPDIENRLPTILIGSVPSELESTPEINVTYPGGIAATTGVVVRSEEVLIVLFVLILWVGAIALFFNRWGKIRMLEPYQPKFQQQHRQSCTVVDPNLLPQHRTCSKINIHCLEHALHSTTLLPESPMRLRQNSVFVGGSNLSLMKSSLARRSKSAFDLQSLVTADSMIPTAMDNDEPVGFYALKSYHTPEHLKAPLSRDRRSSVFQFDKADLSVRQLQKDRRKSICNFDKSDALPFPMPRDRGSSICHFDRPDGLTRPLLRDRGMSISRPCNVENIRGLSHREKMNVYAALREARVNMDRPDSIVKNNKSRTSITHIEEEMEHEPKLETASRKSSKHDKTSFVRSIRRIKRPSLTNLEKLESLGKTIHQTADSPPDQGEGSGSSSREKKHSDSQLDQPSCSKTTEVVFGYKATCV